MCQELSAARLKMHRPFPPPTSPPRRRRHRHRVKRHRLDLVWAPRAPAAVEWLTVTLEIIAILDRKKCYMFVKSCLSSMSFCVGYRSAPGQDTGVDGCTTNRLCIASKPPSQRPPSRWDVKVREAAARPSRFLPRMWFHPSVGPALGPDAELSCGPKWRFISKHEVDYCSLAPLPMRR